MRTREEVLQYALSFPNVYEERPFRDQGWQLVRVKGSRKTFLWIYERNGYINLNVKVDPQWRDFWRSTYASVIAIKNRCSLFTGSETHKGCRITDSLCFSPAKFRLMIFCFYKYKWTF